MDLFERNLSVSIEDIEFEFPRYSRIPWLDFYLNPRRLRGSDFLMRWSQGKWSEHSLIQAVNKTGKFIAFPYGPSSTAPDDNVREFELYFERLEKAGLGEIKRPDVLIFRKRDEVCAGKIIRQLGGEQELPFTPEDNKLLRDLVSKAVIAVECENSLWKVAQMPSYGVKLKPMRRLGGRLGVPSNAVLPTVIIKEEDRTPLLEWQKRTGLEIHIWHAFYDKAFGIALNRIEELITKSLIAPTTQTFQAPGGATTKKIIYKVYYHYAYPLAETVEEPKLIADSIVDKNGHILPYVRFEGGVVELTNEALAELTKLSR